MLILIFYCMLSDKFVFMKILMTLLRQSFNKPLGIVEVFESSRWQMIIHYVCVIIDILYLYYINVLNI